MSVQKRVEQKIRTALLRIEHTACRRCELDKETVQKLREDARILAADPEFIIQWHRRTFPDEWLEGMLAEASQPHNGSQPVFNRRLFKWINNARQRAKLAAKNRAPAQVPEGNLL